MFAAPIFFKTAVFKYAVVVTLIACSYAFGRYEGKAYEKAKAAIAINVANAKTDETTADIKTASQPVVTKYVDKIVHIEKKVPVYIDRIRTEVTPDRNKLCVTPVIIETYNDSLEYKGPVQ